MSLRLLLEGSRDNMLLRYLEAVKKAYPDMTLSMLKKVLLERLVSYAHIMSLSLGSNFYLAGAARYYFNGDLTRNKEVNLLNPDVEDDFDDDVCGKLSLIIKYLRDKYLDSDATKWEQPEDFGTLPIDKLFNKYKRVITPKQEKVVKPENEEDYIVGLPKDYTYEIIYTFGDVKKYARPNAPNSWCISTGEGNLLHYMRQNNSFFVVFKRNDWLSIPQEKGPEYPLDTYGLSAMAMQLSKEDGHIVAGTTRWNHGPNFDISNADYRVSQDLLENLTGITPDGLKKIRNTYSKFLSKHTGKTKSDSGIKISANDFNEARRRFTYIKLCIKNSQSPFIPTPRNANGMFDNYRVISADKPEFSDTSSDEWKKRGWRKCIVSVTIKVNDIPFTTMIDHGQVLNTEVLSNEDNIKPATFYTENDNGSFKKDNDDDNYLIFKVKNKCGVYDKKNKRSIEINGEKLFLNVLDTMWRTMIFVIGRSRYAIYDKTTEKFVSYNGRDEFEKIFMAYDSIRGNWEMNISEKTDYIRSKMANVVVEYATGEMFSLNLETFDMFKNNAGAATGYVATCIFGDKLVLMRRVSRNNYADQPIAANFGCEYARGYYDMSSTNLKYDRNIEVPHFKMAYANNFKEVPQFSGMDIRGAFTDGWSTYIKVLDYDIRTNPHNSRTNQRYYKFFDMNSMKFIKSPLDDEYFMREWGNFNIAGNLYILLRTPSKNGFVFNPESCEFLYNDIFNGRIEKYFKIRNGEYLAIKYGTRCEYRNSYILVKSSNGEPLSENGEVKRFASIEHPYPKHNYATHDWAHPKYDLIFTGINGITYGLKGDKLVRINSANIYESKNKKKLPLLTESDDGLLACLDMIERLEKI